MRIQKCYGTLNKLAMTTHLNSELPTLLYTDGISDCIGIVTIVRDKNQKIKQISLCHSLSEHHAPSIDETIAYNKVIQELRKNESIANINNSVRTFFYQEIALFFACCFRRMLHTSESDDNVKILIHPGGYYNHKTAFDFSRIYIWTELYKQAYPKKLITFSVEMIDKQYLIKNPTSILISSQQILLPIDNSINNTLLFHRKTTEPLIKKSRSICKLL